MNKEERKKETEQIQEGLCPFGAQALIKAGVQNVAALAPLCTLGHVAVKGLLLQACRCVQDWALIEFAQRS